MQFHLESPWGATLMLLNELELEQNTEVGKDSGPILGRLWTKIDEILGSMSMKLNAEFMEGG